MKRFAFIVLILALLSFPAFSQWRLDVGFNAPRGTGLVLGSQEVASFGGMDLMSWPFIPIPEVSVHYTGELGPLRVGIGIRAFSALVESIAWPNAFLELDAGKAVVELQFGGGLFYPFGIIPGTSIATGKVFIPDLSAWYKLGKKQSLRLGIGLLGVYVPEVFGDALPVLVYFGGKLAVPL